MKVVLVGEAWGRHEAQFQHALVGPSGRELTLELGIAKFMPSMKIPCRSCKHDTEFTDGFCSFCRNRIWPNEFNLIDHWRSLHTNHDLAVTNVFNQQPPTLYHFPEMGWTPVVVTQSGASQSTIRRESDGLETRVPTRDLAFNDLGAFFSFDRQTEMPPWKPSKRIPGTHLKAQYFYHIERLWRELSNLNPNLVVCMGNAACWAILGQTKITTLRGTVAWSDRLRLKCLPIFHPASVLRNPVQRVSNIADFQKASRESEFAEIRRLERWITQVDPTEEGISNGQEWFRRPTPAYAIDIETYSGLVTMVGFARSKDDMLVIPFRSLDGNYWPTSKLELEAWKLVQSGLETPQDKIFQNGLYDMSYLIGMGFKITNVAHDTMLHHHAEYPELPKSLGYLGSVYSDEIAWKQIKSYGSLKRDE